MSVVAQWRASHVPGRWPVLMGPTSLVVVDPGAVADLSGLWQRVASSSSMDELVAELATIGPDRSPDLVALFWSAAGMRSLVRGRIRLLDPATAEVVAAETGLLTWQELGLGRHQQLEVDLGAGPVGSRGLPLVLGAVWAGAIRMEAEAAVDSASPQGAPRGSVVGLTRPVTDSIEGGLVAGSSGGSVSVDSGRGYSERTFSDPIAAGAVWPPEPTRRVTPLMSRPDLVVSAAGTAAEPAAESAEPRLAEPRFAEPPAEPKLESPRTDPPTVVDELAAVTDEPLPAISESVASVAPDAAAQLSAEGVPALAGAAPVLVNALLCVRGHPNSPAASRCVRCRAKIRGRRKQLVPRPVLARLQGPDGSTVAITQPVLVGRSPVNRDDLAEEPILFRVPSPGRDISRTHLLVQPVDWEIQLIDLHSTNGTLVVLPGAESAKSGSGAAEPRSTGEPIRLTPGQPVAVGVGTRIEIGDGVTLNLIEPS